MGYNCRQFYDIRYAGGILITGILGSLLGGAALVISILNYRRDKPQLKVTLKWDMQEIGTRRMMGIVKVANVGRRPVHLSIVALQINADHKYRAMILNDSIKGKRLDEGDKPEGFTVNYDQMAEHKGHWDKIRAMAEDSTGKAYYSEYPKDKPSWAN
ncbi:hypothetical protein [Tunturiibacter gelidiferens]|uniref:hypothetical protein n=1 Tax=Tunturiibacter gelidiferens TaxID=3069689 RepID=UPI003D9B61BA